MSFSIFDPKVCIGLKFSVFETEAAETSEIHSGQNFKVSTRNHLIARNPDKNYKWAQIL